MEKPFEGKKLAIIGASYLQLPLINRAKEMGLETHVFAWAADDVGEKAADYFYPISTVDKEKILEKCQEIEIDGICSISSDVAAVTVNYVANEMQLVGNSPACTALSTNKILMRKCFYEHGDPSPRSVQITSMDELDKIELDFPVIVKPADRSGSRGIRRLDSRDGLFEAVEEAIECSFEKSAIVEEFVEGQEYSVEFISWKGKHTFLALTQKYTTGAPRFIETAHLEPADVPYDMTERIKRVVTHALDSLGVEYGASHSEVKVSDSGDINLIEIGARMGGDLIGSDLVLLSTGVDYIADVIRIALGEPPQSIRKYDRASAVRFIFDKKDIETLECIKREAPQLIIEESVDELLGSEIKDSSQRCGYFLLCAKSRDELQGYMPETGEQGQAD